jgi:hypothetical protein
MSFSTKRIMITGGAGFLALQLPFCFEVRSLGDRLMSSPPE